MPRFTVKRKGRLKTSVRAERASKLRVRKQGWVDPYPFIMGTVPEKYVYSELSKRNIPFLFQNELRFVIPEIEYDNWFRPDIAIPSLRIIIEVQGSYWHSKPEQIEKDAFKFAIYQELGWKVLIWWDFDILEDLPRLFAEEPAFIPYQVDYRNTKSTEYIENKKYIDDTKGIATMNRNRGLRKAYKKRAVRQKYKR